MLRIIAYVNETGTSGVNTSGLGSERESLVLRREADFIIDGLRARLAEAEAVQAAFTRASDDPTTAARTRVIEAAKAWAHGDSDESVDGLTDAVDALLALEAETPEVGT